MMNTLTTKNTQASSSTTAGTEAETDEIRQVTATEKKNTEGYIQTISKLIKAMIETTLLQRNVNMTIKEGLPKLQEALNSLIESRRATSMAHQRLKQNKKIKRRAEEVISPGSEMTPTGKKLKERARRDEEEDPLGLHSFASQTKTLGSMYYQGEKRRK